MAKSLSFKLRYAVAFAVTFSALSTSLFPLYLFDIFHEITDEAILLTGVWLVLVSITALTAAHRNLWGDGWPVLLYRYLMPLAILPLFITDIQSMEKTLLFSFQTLISTLAWRCHKWLRAVAAEEFDHLWPEYRAQKVREKAAKERLKRRRRGLRK